MLMSGFSDCHQYIAGCWVPSTNRHTIPVHNSSTEEIVGAAPCGSIDDVNRAVAAAREAFTTFSQTPLNQRIRWLSEIADQLSKQRDSLSELIASEVGMPIKMTKSIQVAAPIQAIRDYANILESYPFEETIGDSLIIKEPVGIVAAITPWNFPLYQIIHKIAPAIGAGCCMVVKPSEIAPLNAQVLADAIDKTSLPNGVFNLVCGSGIPVGEALVSHPNVDMISFTGSTRAGKRIAGLGADRIKRVALELGGKSANIILDDADIERAVRKGVSNCYLNSGQTCSALTRMLVPRDLHDQIAELAGSAARRFVVGDPTSNSTHLGPLISANQRDRVLDYIRSGIEEGATLVAGGPEMPTGLTRGYYVQPTVFSNVENHMTIAQEEIFGPVLCIIPYDTEDHAIAIANDSPFGLSGGVWSADVDRAHRVARRLRTGQVDINGAAFNPLAPFGGYKMSGYGREYGSHGVSEYLETKAIQR